MRLERLGRLLASSALVGISGCSVAVSDVGSVPINPEACVQGGNTEVARDAHLVFAEMTPHAASSTFVALVGGSTNPAEPDRQILRARAVFRPSFAAGNYDAAALAGLDPDRCRLAVRSPLTMDVVIPAFVPPDSTNGGPFDIDFWSETNGEPMRQFPGDHSWLRPMCDDGNVFFVHNTGFDEPVEAQSNGANLTITVDALEVTTGLRLGTEAASLLARIPVVAQVSRQGLTVAYLRAVFTCDQGPYTIGGVIDVGSEHTIEIYWDTGRNGVYDADCDPSCTGRATGTADGLAITLGTDRTDFDVRTACQVPSGFSETCAPRPSP